MLHLVLKTGLIFSHINKTIKYISLFIIIIFYHFSYGESLNFLSWRTLLPFYKNRYSSIYKGKLIFDPNLKNLVMVNLNGEVWKYNEYKWDYIYIYKSTVYPKYCETIFDDEKDCICAVDSGMNVFYLMDSVWQRVVPTSKPEFIPRLNFGICYDADRKRIILFGGYFNGSPYYLNDTWVFDGTNWNEITTHPIPPARAGHQLIYYNYRHKAVLFGGTRTNGRLNDTWEFDGKDWYELNCTVAPSIRSNHQMVFVPHRNIILCFGGYGYPCSYDLYDTWAYNNQGWHEIKTHRYPLFTGPIGYDPIQDRIVMIGPNSETWEFDFQDWNQIRPPLPYPKGRREHAMAYDEDRGTTVMFGGWGISDDDGTWEFTDHKWVNNDTRNLSSSIEEPQMAYDSTRKKMVIFRGDFVSETWEYNSIDWELRVEHAPCHPYLQSIGGCFRFDCAMTYDKILRGCVLYGGYFWWNMEGYTLNDISLYDGTNWILLGLQQTAIRHTLTFHEGLNRTVLLQAPNSNELYYLDCAPYGLDCSWSALPNPNPPEPRSNSVIIYNSARRSLFLFGGGLEDNTVYHDAIKMYNELWEYKDYRWIKYDLSLKPCPIWKHCMIYDKKEDEAILFGGEYIEIKPDTWILYNPLYLEGYFRPKVFLAGFWDTRLVEGEHGNLKIFLIAQAWKDLQVKKAIIPNSRHPEPDIIIPGIDGDDNHYFYLEVELTMAPSSEKYLVQFLVEDSIGYYSEPWPYLVVHH